MNAKKKIDIESPLLCSNRTTMKKFFFLFIFTFLAASGFSQEIDSTKVFYYDPTYNPDYSLYDTYGNYQENGLYTLPCELLEFNVSSNNKGIEFYWATITETNTSKFLIEYLNLNGIWEHVDYVAASGNSNSIVEYHFSSSNIYENSSIFRLILIDNDGTKRSIAMSSANSIEEKQINPINNFRVSSNNSMVNLLWDCNSNNIETHVSVYSINGQMLFSETNNSTEGFNYLENISLANGNAFIAVVETAYGSSIVKFGL